MPEEVFCIDRERHEKDIKNTQLEGVTNTFFGNQFLSYFNKIPQIGHYANVETKSLKGYYVDRINESITGTTLPDISVPSTDLSYYGHQNVPFASAGDGNLGTILVRIKLDRYLNNYTALANWSYLKYDWTQGGRNFEFSNQELEGIFYVEFIDGEENITRRIKYKVWIENLPSISLAVNTPDEIDFDVTLKVTDINLNEFIEGSVLADPARF